MENIKYYVVTSYQAPIEDDITRSFRYRKSADKYGMKLVEKYGHCVVVTFINTTEVEEENY